MEFKHYCKIQDKIIVLHCADMCEVCGAEDLVNNRHMQDSSVNDYELEFSAVGVIKKTGKCLENP